MRAFCEWLRRCGGRHSRDSSHFNLVLLEGLLYAVGSAVAKRKFEWKSAFFAKLVLFSGDSGQRRNLLYWRKTVRHLRGFALQTKGEAYKKVLRKALTKRSLRAKSEALQKWRAHARLFLEYAKRTALLLNQGSRRKWEQPPGQQKAYQNLAMKTGFSLLHKLLLEKGHRKHLLGEIRALSRGFASWKRHCAVFSLNESCHFVRLRPAGQPTRQWAARKIAKVFASFEAEQSRSRLKTLLIFWRKQTAMRMRKPGKSTVAKKIIGSQSLVNMNMERDLAKRQVGRQRLRRLGYARVLAETLEKQHEAKLQSAFDSMVEQWLVSNSPRSCNKSSNE